MKKTGIILTLGSLFLTVSPAFAAVTVTSGPTSLASTATVAPASASPIGLFAFNLSPTAGETLASVSVKVNKAVSSTLTSADLAGLTVYKDNGDGIFNSSTDLLSGTQSTVNINATSTVSLTSNTTIATSTKYFIAVSTSPSWTDSAPADAFTATVPKLGIVTSDNSPTSTPATTALITADTTGPVLTSVVAMNTGGTSIKEPSDGLDFTFSEPTNKPVVTNANIGTLLLLNNSHSFLDSAGNIGAATWNVSGTDLTVVLSGNISTTVASAAISDTVTVNLPSTITDLVGNKASGSAAITGSFGTTGPVLTTVVASNTGGTAAKEHGDSLDFTFSMATNKPAITASNISSVFSLNNGHSFLDSVGNLESATWNVSGTDLTIILAGSATTTVATVMPGDLTTVLMPSIITDGSGNTATGNATITGSFGNTTGPILTSVVAKNTGGTNYKEPGDSLDFMFSEATNKPAVTNANIGSIFSLNNSHTFLDTAGNIGTTSWNAAGTILTMILSGISTTTVATVMPGDIVGVKMPSVITDVSGDPASGTAIIIGNFSGNTGNGIHLKKGQCANGLVNGRLYRTPGDAKTYLAAACRLKVFRGKALSRAEGKKFKNIITLPSLAGLVVTPKPTPSTKKSSESENDSDKEKKSNNITSGQSSVQSSTNSDSSEKGKSNGKEKENESSNGKAKGKNK